MVVTDLRNIECVIGRVYTRGEWGIIDRSGGLARTEFIQSEGPEKLLHASDDVQDSDTESDWGF